MSMHTRKIVFVSTQMEAGGVQVRATRMLRALREEGNDARLLFLYTKRSVFQGLDGVETLFATRPSSPVHYAVIVWRLVKYVRRLKPDVIVGFAHFSSPLAAIAGVIAGTPKRLATQAAPPSSFGFVGRVLDWICGTLGLYTANIAASHATTAYYAAYPRKYRATLRTVVNGVEWSPSRLTSEEARETFGLPPSGFLILNCGRLSSEKNQALLLDALHGLPDAHLAILGDGELRAELERRIAELGLGGRVTLLGEVPPSRVPDFLRAGDVFAFPSRFEAFGLAAAEAMLAGLPILATDEPGLREVVGSGGKLLSIGDSAVWTAALAELKDDLALRSKAARLAAARGQRFSFHEMLSGFKAAMV